MVREGQAADVGVNGLSWSRANTNGKRNQMFGPVRSVERIGAIAESR